MVLVICRRAWVYKASDARPEIATRGLVIAILQLELLGKIGELVALAACGTLSIVRRVPLGRTIMSRRPHVFGFGRA
jgi:hypothetical protein